jgi:outer membrane lipoprotein-sorting protein
MIFSSFNKMAKLIPALILIIIPNAVSVPCGHCQDVPSVSEIVERVKGVYEDTCCFQARFDQLTVNVAMDLKDRFRGTIYVRKPASIALEVSYPEKQKVALKGRSYTVYFPRDGSAVTGEIPPDINIENFFGFFANIRDMDRDFEVSFPSKKQSERENLYFLQLIDTRNRGGAHRVTLGIDRESYVIRRALISDALGNYNRFDLSGTVFRSSLPDTIFTIEEKKREPIGSGLKTGNE